MPAITSTHTWPNNTVTFTTAEANLTKVLSLTPKSEEGAWKALTMRMVALILQFDAAAPLESGRSPVQPVAIGPYGQLIGWMGLGG